MVELLVAGLCAGGYACNHAFEAYYQGNLALKQQVRAYRQDFESLVGKWPLYVTPAAGALVGGHSARLKLGREIYLDLQSEEVVLMYKKEF